MKIPVVDLPVPDRQLKTKGLAEGRKWNTGFPQSGYRTRKQESVCAAAKHLVGEGVGITAGSADGACVADVPKR